MTEPHVANLPDAIAKYVVNRCDFYTIALKRLRDGTISALVHEAVDPIDSGDPDKPNLPLIESLISSDYENTLLLRDIYKKSTYGNQRARTVISMSELFKASEDFEESGLLLYRHLCHLGDLHKATYHAMEQFHEQRLLRLIELEDKVRYHRLRLG